MNLLCIPLETIKMFPNVTSDQYPINPASIHLLVEITAMFSISLGPHDTVKAFILMSTMRLGFYSLCC